MSFQENLKRLREAAGLSQTALGKRAKVTQQLIAHIELGLVKSSKKVYRLADALNVSASELDPNIPAEDTPVVEVPILAWVSAGELTKADFSDVTRLGTHYATDLRAGDWIAFRVDGESMDLISPPGSIILVNRKEKRLAPNACYVIDDGEGGTTYKRYRPSPRRFEPVSRNEAIKAIPLPKDREPTIVGRVRRTILDM